MSDAPTLEKPKPEQLQKAQNDKFFKAIGYNVEIANPGSKVVEKLKAGAKKSEEAGKTQHKIDLRDTKWEVLADAAVLEAKGVLSAIRSLQPPSTSQVQILEPAIKDVEAKLKLVRAENLAAVSKDQVEELKASTNTLNKLLDGDPHKKSLDLFNKATETARQGTPDLESKLDPLLIRLRKGETPLRREQAAKFVAELIQLVRHLMVDEVSQNTKKWFGGQLTDITGRVERAEEAAEAGKQTAEDLLEEVSVLDELDRAAQLGDVPGLDEVTVANMFRKRSIAQNAMAANDFDSAADMLRELRTETRIWSKQQGVGATELIQAWDKVAPEVGKLLGKAETLAKPNVLPPQLQTQAQAVIIDLQKLISADVGVGVGYGDAVKRFQQARDTLAAITQRGTDAVEFAPADADKRIVALDGQAKEAIGTLDTELNKQAKDGAKKAIDAVTGPLATRRVDALLLWDEKKEKAFDARSLDEAATAKALTAVRDEARNASTGSGLAQALTQLEIEAVRPAYEQARSRAEEMVHKLMSIDVMDGTLAMQDLDDMDAAAQTAPDAKTLVDLTKEYDDAAKRFETTGQRIGVELSKARRAVDELIKPVEGQLKELLDGLNRLKSTERQKPYETLHGALSQQYASVRALRGVDTIPVLQDALTEARLLVADLEDALAGVQGKKQKGKQSPDEARKMIEKYKTDLADKTVQRYMAMTAADIGDKIEELAGTLGDQGLAKMREQMEEVRKLVEDCETKAKEAETKFKTIEIEGGKVTKILGTDAFSKAEKFKEATKAKLKSLIADGAFEGGHDEALQKIKDLAVELDRMAKGPANVLGVSAEIADGEEKAVQAIRDKEIEKKKWETELVVMEKQLAGLEEKANATELAGLKTTFEEAKKAAEKGGDYAMGRDQLQAIRDRAALVTANPNGLAITSRNKLPQVNTRWRNAYKNFQAALIEVKKGVAETEIDEAGRTAVDKALTEVRCLFNPAAFETTVTAITKQGATERERLAARELGLREARRMQAYLSSDFRLRELMSTPFSKSMRSVISELNLSLLDIENNMLVSM